MKTSNKLLILFLVFLFSIPLVMIMGLKAAIKNNQYTMKNIYGGNTVAFKYLRPFKVLKIDGGPQGDNPLKCTIRYGDKYGYRFNNYNPQQFEDGRLDSCNVSTAGDTLVIRYIARANEALEKNNYYTGVELEITIPETIPVVANAAVANMDSSVSHFSSLDFTLVNNAELNISGNSNPRTVIAEKNNYTTIPETVFPKIVVDATSSQINLGENNAVKNMQVSLKGQSRFNLNEKASIDTLSGSIADESVFNVPYRFVKKLQ